MPSIVMNANTTAQWHQLVTDAESAASVELNEEIESYLVFLLMRYIERPDIASSMLATDFLEGLHSLGKIRNHRLKEVGDQCLLYSGLFPQRARRKRVRISYFVDLGRSAYISLADNLKLATADLYINLAQWFVPVMDVMHAMRDLDNNSQASVLDPINAVELWQDTGSKGAYRALEIALKGDLAQTDIQASKHYKNKNDMH